MAPSKDTLWTASPQSPATSSDRTHSGVTTQPHVQLDSILATLSLGPVGISDGLNQTDAQLIGQAFRNAKDSTLLRPSRPLSTVDSVWTNKSLAPAPTPGVRSIEIVQKPLYHNSAVSKAEALNIGDGIPGVHSSDVGADIRSGSAADVRGTHAALSGAGPNSHYFLAWMTTVDVTLQATDLYPPPKPGTALAVRQHIAKPEGGNFQTGCEDGKAAVPACVDILPAGQLPSIQAVGGAISDYSYWSVYEPTANGAYFLGELSKFVHVSPMRFEAVDTKGSGPCGITVTMKGTSGEKVTLAAVDPKGIAHVVAVTVSETGTAVIEL